MGGNSENITEASKRFGGMPVELLQESEQFSNDRGLVYPDNTLVVSVFSSMLTQWRASNGVRFGLDYNVLDFVYRVKKVQPEQEEEVFDLLQVMEQVAIAELAKKR